MKRGAFDHKLMVAVVFLLSIGLVMVFSASAGSALAKHQNKFQVIRSQAIWACLGLGVLSFCSKMDYHALRPLARPALVLSVILLIMVFIPGLGVRRGGATRWLRILGFTFQPSELAKLALILYLSDFLSSRPEEDRASFTRYVLPALVVLGGLTALVLRQPNFSYTLILSTVGFCMIGLLYRRERHLVGIALVGVVSAVLLVLNSPYRRRRLFGYLDPWEDPYGTGWNIIQSLYALASGGMWGLGIGRGRQKFEYLPQEHSDYIFATVGEELGYIGAFAMLALFGFIFWRGLRIAMRAADDFGTLLAYGITLSLTLQAIINISVVVGSIPPTGVPLPFISSGGSSLVASLAAVGVLLSISRTQVDPWGRARSRRRPTRRAGERPRGEAP